MQHKMNYYFPALSAVSFINGLSGEICEGLYNLNTLSCNSCASSFCPAWVAKANNCLITSMLSLSSLLFIGFGHSIFALVLGTILFGVGFGMFDANNMPILCQFVSARYRATAYGIMNMCGVFAGAAITSILGESTDAGHLGRDFALLAVFVLIMLVILVTCLRPKTIDMKD